MKKQTVFIIFFAVLLALTAFASEPLLVDGADLLTDSEEYLLLEKLEGIRQSENMDVVVVTVDTLGYKSAMEYADDFYDYNGYANDGILLLISMAEREWHISTAGFGITAITDAGIEYISDKFMYDLSEGFYCDAFLIFAEQCEEFIWQARNGEPFDVDNMPKEPFDVLGTAVIAFVIGLVISLIVTGVMKGQLKSVHAQTKANAYLKAGSLNITNSQDIFLYRNVTRTVIQTNTSSKGGSGMHMSSSGRTHGGGGGRF